MGWRAKAKEGRIGIFRSRFKTIKLPGEIIKRKKIVMFHNKIKIKLINALNNNKKK